MHRSSAPGFCAAHGPSVRRVEEETAKEQQSSLQLEELRPARSLQIFIDLGRSGASHPASPRKASQRRAEEHVGERPADWSHRDGPRFTGIKNGMIMATSRKHMKFMKLCHVTDEAEIMMLTQWLTPLNEWHVVLPMDWPMIIILTCIYQFT